MVQRFYFILRERVRWVAFEHVVTFSLSVSRLEEVIRGGRRRRRSGLGWVKFGVWSAMVDWGEM